MDVEAPPRRPPVASDAEIRAYLLPLLKAGQRPTYAAMRAAFGGGGNTRLVRLRKQVEAEVSGAEGPITSPVVTQGDLVARLEEVLDRRLQAFEETSREWMRQLQAALDGLGANLLQKSARERTEVHTERLETLERRMVAAVKHLEGYSRNSERKRGGAQAHTSELGDVPPAWARQAAAAAVAALDGRLQSLQEAVQDTAAGSRSAFEAAADIARETTASGVVHFDGASQELRTLVGDARDHLSRHDAGWRDVRHAISDAQNAIESAARQRSAVADHRARKIGEALIAFADLHLTQVELLELGVLSGRIGLPPPRPTRRRRRR